jgi:beta-N-acetylhexosaminidase
MRQGLRPPIAVLAVLAAVSLAAGAIVGANREDGPTPRLPEASGGRPLEQVSFLATIVPQAPERRRPTGGGVPRGVAELARRLPLERKVAQLFLLGFRGSDLNAEIFRRLRRLDLGGIVIDRHNYRDPDLLRQLAGEAAVIARQENHVTPWVLAPQEGGDLNAFPDLPPALAPADLASANEAGAQAAEAARTLGDLDVTGVLGPVLDIGVEGGSPLGSRVYSDDPEEVAGFADAVISAYREQRLFSAVSHFPGLGAADRSTEEGPASVGLGLPELRLRDLLPFRAAIEVGVPGVVLSHALYPMSDFTVPGSLSRAIATDLLRGELRFDGVAITDDLADPAISAVTSVPEAAVRAVRAGVDMLLISGPAGDQQAAYVAVLRAARSGNIPRRRLDEAIGRILLAKQGYGLID